MSFDPSKLVSLIIPFIFLKATWSCFFQYADFSIIPKLPGTHGENVTICLCTTPVYSYALNEAYTSSSPCRTAA